MGAAGERVEEGNLFKAQTLHRVGHNCKHAHGQNDVRIQVAYSNEVDQERDVGNDHSPQGDLVKTAVQHSSFNSTLAGVTHI